MQKNGAGLHTASSCFWDNSSDGKEHNFWIFQLATLMLVALRLGSVLFFFSKCYHFGVISYSLVFLPLGCDANFALHGVLGCCESFILKILDVNNYKHAYRGMHLMTVSFFCL